MTPHELRHRTKLFAVDIIRFCRSLPKTDDARVIRERARIDVEAINERERVTDHDVAAFVDVVQAAIGGQAVTQVYEGERLFDLVIRFLPEFRQDVDAIGNILVSTRQIVHNIKDYISGPCNMVFPKLAHSSSQIFC